MKWTENMFGARSEDRRLRSTWVWYVHSCGYLADNRVCGTEWVDQSYLRQHAAAGLFSASDRAKTPNRFSKLPTGNPWRLPGHHPRSCPPKPFSLLGAPVFRVPLSLWLHGPGESSPPSRATCYYLYGIAKNRWAYENVKYGRNEDCEKKTNKEVCASDYVN